MWLILVTIYERNLRLWSHAHEKFLFMHNSWVLNYNVKLFKRLATDYPHRLYQHRADPITNNNSSYSYVFGLRPQTIKVLQRIFLIENSN